MSWHADYFATFEISNSPEVNPAEVAAELRKALTGFKFDMGPKGGPRTIKVIEVTWKIRPH